MRFKFSNLKRRFDSIFGNSTNDKKIIMLIVVAYTSIFSYFSYLRYEDFFTTNWDLGINMQLLWTTTHGYVMFESGDYEFMGVRSFLEVHSTYIAYLVALVYKILPYATFLFILQSFVVSMAILPLYLIGMKIGVKRNLMFLALFVYLLNFGLLSGMLYDFHWEAFLPFEFFTMFYLQLRKKYAFSLIPFAVGCATLEVFPFLAAGSILYFMLERGSLASLLRERERGGHEFYLLVAYLALTIVAYAIIRILQLVVVHALVGFPVHSSSVSESFTSLLIINTNVTLLFHSLFYWLILYASFGFMSTAYPKHVILALPWLFFTFLIDPSFASYFGDQYAFIAIIPIATGFVFGLFTLQESVSTQLGKLYLGICLFSALILTSISSLKGVSKFLLSYPSSTTTAILDILFFLPLILILMFRLVEKHNTSHKLGVAKSGSKKPYRTPGLRAKLRFFHIVVLSFILLILFNLILSPLNTSNFQATPLPGYSFQYTTNPEFPYLKHVLSKIETSQTIVASDNLFPFVANNPNAYSLAWFPYNSDVMRFFPFSPTNIPKYVLVDSSQFFLMPPFLSHLIFNQSQYDLIAFVNYNKNPGSIYLFQAYSSLPTTFYNVTKEPPQLFFYSKNLAIGPSGKVVQYSGSKFGTVIESSPSTNLTGNGINIWYGPYITLNPGTYRAVIVLKGGSYSKSQANAPLLIMNSNGFGGPTYYDTVIYSNQLSSSKWTNLTFIFTVKEPYPLTEFRGYLVVCHSKVTGYILLNYIEIDLLT